MRTLKNVLLLVLLVFIGETSSAVIRGGEITYRNTGSLTYDVFFTIYRDCGDTMLIIPDSSASILCASGSTSDMEPLDLVLVSIDRLPRVCARDTTTCNPANTSGTGMGVEKHVYKASISLQSGTYQRFASCDNIQFTLFLANRSDDYTNIGKFSYFNFATLNMDQASDNSSPAFSYDPLVYLACNHPVYMNYGAHDTADYDSLSYRMVNPMSDFMSIMNYNTGFSAKKPLTVYDPLKNGDVKPEANPPIGFYVDSINGSMIFTPTNSNESTVSVLEVTEWRKNSSGVWQEIGQIRRDIGWISISFPYNNPPEIKGPYKYAVCEGSSLCFDIETDDKTFVPPPPAPIPDPDTLSISWNKGIPGATFAVKNPGHIHPTARFCWTPDTGQASNLPYLFTVSVSDNACPSSAMVTKVFSIVVDAPLGPVDLGPDTAITPGSSVILDGGPGGNYLWNTGETTRTIVADTFGKFWVTVSNTCNSVSDTIEIFKFISVPDLPLHNVVLFPNPASDVLHIRSDHKGDLHIAILNMAGQVVQENSARRSSVNDPFELPLGPNITSGIYIVQVSIPEGTLRKLIRINRD